MLRIRTRRFHTVSGDMIKWTYSTTNLNYFRRYLFMYPSKDKKSKHTHKYRMYRNVIVCTMSWSTKPECTTISLMKIGSQCESFLTFHENKVNLNKKIRFFSLLSSLVYCAPFHALLLSPFFVINSVTLLLSSLHNRTNAYHLHHLLSCIEVYTDARTPHTRSHAK